MLHPCSSCRRHVEIADTTCPFCGARLAARPGGTLLAGRWSRAAVFAGAALTGCYTGTPPSPQYGPPPPPDDHQRVPPPDASPDPASTFAKPPLANTMLRGRVIDRASGRPMPGAIVMAHGPDKKVVGTDNKGEYAFRNLTPGAYRLEIKRPAGARIAGARVINLVDGAPQQVNLHVDLRRQLDPDELGEGRHQNHPCDNGVCAPYGAPPARRRVV